MKGEELTTNMHYEFVGDRIPRFDFAVLAVYGAINRGVDKEKACADEGITVEEYEDNIERVINNSSW